MVKARSVSALNSTGLSRGYNNFTFPEDKPKEQQDTTIPPPIPVRSKSREHFYHTLEYNNESVDSGVALSSPPCSGHRSSSNSSSQAFPREPEEELVQQMEPVQVQVDGSLFDDPRYVALQVDTVENVADGNLRGRKDIWRSTPALASARVIGRDGSNRCSLRLTHVLGTEIYN